MRIIFVNKYWYERAGAERYVFDIKNALEHNGHEVIPFAMKHEKNEPTVWSRYFVSTSNFDTPKTFMEKWRLLCRMMYSLEAKHKFESLVRDTRPDVVHINNIYHQISPSILDVCTKYNIPVVMTIHDYNLTCPSFKRFSRGGPHECMSVRGRVAELFDRTVKGSFLGTLACTIETLVHLPRYRRAVDMFIAPSEITRDVSVRGGLPAQKVITLGYPVHFEDVPPVEKQDFILFAGRLAVEKGVHHLLAAMQNVEFSLVIAGDGPERKNLEKLAQRLNIGHKVRFLGTISPKDVARHMAEARLVVVPSMWEEIFCFVAHEAFVAGTPVLGTGYPALGDFLRSVDERLICTPDNLREKIAWALSPETDLSGTISKAKRLIAEKYPINKYITVLEGIYRQIGKDRLSSKNVTI